MSNDTSTRSISGGFVLLGVVAASALPTCQAWLGPHYSARRTRSYPTDLRSLIPEENPAFDPYAVSLAGVSYASVLSGLHRLYPPPELEKRNALSRTDGYWPYIQKGQDPPKQFTYGEFDLYFFAQLLDQCRAYSSPSGSDWNEKVFVDIGSGTGRLVLAAAALHPNLKLCRGIEMLEKIHTAAEENKAKCQSENGLSLTTDDSHQLPMALIEFVCGSFEDPYLYFGDADYLFVFSSCFSPYSLSSLSMAIGRQCRPGTVVITTDYMLTLQGEIPPFEDDSNVPSGAYELELVEKVDGWCWLTGGATTAFVHLVKTSLWEPDRGPLKRSELSPEDKAFAVAKALESGELTDYDSFRRGVLNNMAFHGLPDSFYLN